MVEWFYGKDNTQHGPISELEIRNLISTGKIEQTSIIWREGMQDWLPLRDVPEFQISDSGHGHQAPQQIGAQTYMAPAPTESLAVISMVLGILSIVASCMYVGIIFGIPAVICGHLSIKKINNSPVALSGKGMAIAGLITGYLGSLISLCLIGFIIVAISVNGHP